MVIDERLDNDGCCQTHLELVGAVLRVRDDGGLCVPLSLHIVETVVRRYGRPLDPSVVLEGEVLAVGDRELRLLVYRSPVDVEPWTYLVLSCPGEEPVAAVSRTVAGALLYIAGAAPPVSGSR